MTETAPTVEVGIDYPSGRVRATVSQIGAQLIACEVNDHQLFYRSPLTDPANQATHPVRGGVPVMFPWFANGRDGNLQPSHGFARTSRWTLSERTANRILWRLDSAAVADAPSRELWPHDFVALCSHTISTDGVAIELTVSNVSGEPFTYEALFHSYLAVSDATTVTLDGLDGATYLDKLNDFTPTLQRGPVSFAQPLDRIYASDADVVLQDGERQVSIEKVNSTTTTVWNPGEAKRPADVPSGGWRDFVCVEVGNVDQHAVTLEPSAFHTVGTVIRVT